ncbi:MAG: type 4a pilus biogenesis protein PilO [Pseudomonadota bacterium]
MNFLDQLRNLDFNDIGRAPLAVRALLIAVLFAFLVGFGVYYFVVKDQKPLLERAQTEEETLKSTFERKQRKAANLEKYKAQLDEINREFGAMLRQLPGETEIPSLLVDISQTGLASGLEERMFQPESEVPKDFYAEKPIKIRLIGDYHEMGAFVSGVAALPRIVTLHDITLAPDNDEDAGSGDLIMDVTAKTYRYLDDEVE